MNIFQMIIIFTLELKNTLLNLGFGIYYDHCEVYPITDDAKYAKY